MNGTRRIVCDLSREEEKRKLRDRRPPPQDPPTHPPNPLIRLAIHFDPPDAFPVIPLDLFLVETPHRHQHQTHLSLSFSQPRSEWLLLPSRDCRISDFSIMVNGINRRPRSQHTIQVSCNNRFQGRIVKPDAVNVFLLGNGKLICQVGWADSKDVDAAVKAAHAAWPKWKALQASERAQYLRKAADIFREHAEELALLDAVDTGNPVRISKAVLNKRYFVSLTSSFF
jgi:hypothetical protein